MSDTAVYIGVQVSVGDPVFVSFGYILRSRTTGSYGISIFNFLRNHHTVFHNGCTNRYAQTVLSVSP